MRLVPAVVENPSLTVQIKRSYAKPLRKIVSVSQKLGRLGRMQPARRLATQP